MKYWRDATALSFPAERQDVGKQINRWKKAEKIETTEKVEYSMAVIKIYRSALRVMVAINIIAAFLYIHMLLSLIAVGALPDDEKNAKLVIVGMVSSLVSLLLLIVSTILIFKKKQSARSFLFTFSIINISLDISYIWGDWFEVPFMFLVFFLYPIIVLALIYPKYSMDVLFGTKV